MGGRGRVAKMNNKIERKRKKERERERNQQHQVSSEEGDQTLKDSLLSSS